MNNLSTAKYRESSRLVKSEQPNVFSQNELKTCDIEGGGPWYVGILEMQGKPLPSWVRQ